MLHLVHFMCGCTLHKMSVPVISLFAGVLQTTNIPIQIVGFSTIVSMVAYMTKQWVNQNRLLDSVSNPNLQSTEVFDFIVVGGGSAGSVVTYRLSENGKYRVLLLEAGGDPPPTKSVPGAAAFNMHLATDWLYQTVPLKHSGFSLENKRMRWSRGKLLGGTSNLNFMIYTRGHPLDFDNWADLSGDRQWEYEQVLPYFKKFENYNGYWPNAKFHGKGGPVPISKTTYAPLTETWIKGGIDMGYNTSHIDYNGYQIPGFFPIDATIKRGRRGSTYKAYIKPARKRSNLQIYPFSHVTKIDIDSDKKATGVTYERHGKTLKALATKEIIISAGALATPQLLLLSGIGPKDHLEDLKVPSKVDSPGVGGNLQDHVMTIFGPFVFNETIGVILERNITIEHVAEYKLFGTGPFSFIMVSATALFASSFTNGTNWPDVQMFISPVGAGVEYPETLASLCGVKTSVMVDYLKPYHGKDAAFVLINVGRPKSSGTVRLRSTDPYEHPDMDPNFFAEDHDTKVIVEAMQFLVEMFETTPTWQRYNTKFSPYNKLASCAEHNLYSDAYMECFIKHLTMTTWHMCCTAKFGSANDSEAVLHSDLRVKGVSNLRVVDASVMPMVTNGNLNAPTIMIGEKASQLILNDWEKMEKPSQQLQGSELDSKSTTKSSTSLSNVVAPLSALNLFK